MADDTKLLTSVRDHLKMAISAFSSSREDQLDDLKFYAGSPDNKWQWPQDVLAVRGAVQGQTINARPCLTINKLPQHCLQVTNDQRQNRPSGHVIPVDDKADPKMAEILDGIVRHIEYISDADVAYDTACEGQVRTGEGYFRILTDYCDEMSFDQDIKIGRIRNQFSVYMDPTIQDPCGSDAKWCIISEEMLKEDFEREFPNAQPVSGLIVQGVGDEGFSSWITTKTVRVADYYYVEETEKTLLFYPGGITALKGSPQERIASAQGLIPSKERKTTLRAVKYVKTNGYEVLERRDWPGRWIPVVRVIGNEFEIEGQIYISGLIRNAKDPQRMYNYWTSQEAEMLALAPKAPFVGAAGQFEGFEDKWKQANVTNFPYLEYNPVIEEGLQVPPPQRMMPPMAQNGLLQAKMGAADDIKGTTGQYDASLGQDSNEKSGRAIIARERQSDTGTYHYVDNLARAVRHGTRIIIDLVPKIYDTQRIARIIGMDGKTDHVKIDPEMQEPVREIKDEQTGAIIERIYNPGVGKYDVVVTTGPSYKTKRQEASESQAQLLQANPDLWKIAGDLFVRNLDWPGAEELAERLAKIVPPELKDDAESPEIAQAKQVIQGLQQEMQQMAGMLQNVHKSIEAQEQERANMETKIKAFDAETKRITAIQAGLSAEQVQDIVLGTVHGMLTSGDLVGSMPDRQAEDMGEMGMEMPPEQMEQPGMPL